MERFTDNVPAPEPARDLESQNRATELASYFFRQRVAGK